jgi:hypothetical protein
VLSATVLRDSASLLASFPESARSPSSQAPTFPSSAISQSKNTFRKLVSGKLISPVHLYLLCRELARVLSCQVTAMLSYPQLVSVSPRHIHSQLQGPFG